MPGALQHRIAGTIFARRRMETTRAATIRNGLHGPCHLEALLGADRSETGCGDRLNQRRRSLAIDERKEHNG